MSPEFSANPTVGGGFLLFIINYLQVDLIKASKKSNFYIKVVIKKEIKNLIHQITYVIIEGYSKSLVNIGL